MNRFSRLTLLLVLVSLCLGFTLAFPSVLMTSVLQPIVVSLWLAWRLVASVDQSTYWALIILVCCVWLVRVLPPGRPRQATAASRDTQEPTPSISRWQALLRNAQRTNAGEEALRANFQELTEAILGGEDRSGCRIPQQALSIKQVKLPATVREYLHPAPPRGQWLSLDGVRALLARSRGWLRRLVGLAAGPEEATVGELIGWMESMMEIKHDQ